MKFSGLIAAEILADNPSAYYTMNEFSTATTAGDQSTVIGNPPLTIGGDEANTVEFGGSSGPDGGGTVTFTVGGAT